MPRSVCHDTGFQSRGEVEETGFFEFPLARVHEVVEDSMQANGVLLFESTSSRIRGERRPERVKIQSLPSGDEAVAARLEEGVGDGRRGIIVTVETRRKGRKNGTPKRTWSSPVLDHAACLIESLGVEDPTPTTGNSDLSRAVQIPAGTHVPLLLRRFAFSANLRVNRRLLWEVAADVQAGGQTVIQQGAYASATVVEARHSGQGMAGASVKVVLVFDSVSAIDGSNVPLKGTLIIEAGRGGIFG